MLKLIDLYTIINLKRKGKSNREIARECGWDRKTCGYEKENNVIRLIRIGLQLGDQRFKSARDLHRTDNKDIFIVLF